MRKYIIAFVGILIATIAIAATKADIEKQKIEDWIANSTDGFFKVDTINEKATDAGVTVEGTLLKDGNVSSASLKPATAAAFPFYLSDGTTEIGSYSTAGAWTLGPSGYTGTHTVNGALKIEQNNALVSHTIIGNSNVQGTAQKHTIVRQYPVISLGTKLIIPFLSQGGLTSQTICSVKGFTAVFNTVFPLPFEINFSLNHLTSLGTFTSWGGIGNFASITTNGMNVEITFTSAYTGTTSDGIFVTIEYMTNNSSHSIDVPNISMN